MNKQRVKNLRAWALSKCREWNWNVNLAEIAAQLIDEDIGTDSEEFAALGSAFEEFFGPSDQNAKHNWEIVGHIIEQFS